MGQTTKTKVSGEKREKSLNKREIHRGRRRLDKRMTIFGSVLSPPLSPSLLLSLHPANP